MINKKQLIVTWVIAILLLGGCSSPTSIKPFEGTWAPVSKVYLNFGKMIIKNDSIEWESGQKVSYLVIKQQRDETVIGFKDKILPKFHGREYKFIRFTPGKTPYVKDKGIEVSFYEPSRDLNDNNAMWGVYVRSEE